jgi:hypothetical protein
MRRILLGAAAVASMFCAFAAHPVHADDQTPSSTYGMAVQIEDKTVSTANQILDATPMPAGWQVRHVCLSVQQLDHYWCVFLPFPY